MVHSFKPYPVVLFNCFTEFAFPEKDCTEYGDNSERDDEVPNHRQVCDGIEDIVRHSFDFLM